MSGSRTIITLILPTAAFVYLIGMVLSGAPPVQRQLVPFEAKGILKTVPERIRRIELNGGAEWITLVRAGEATWATAEGREVSTEAGKRISMAIQMMHTSSPVRVIPPEELSGVDVAGFELEPPQIVAKLYETGESPTLSVRFGGRNPDGFLQYMRIDGDGGVYLMSRFVGEGWTKALDRIAHP